MVAIPIRRAAPSSSHRRLPVAALLIAAACPAAAAAGVTGVEIVPFAGYQVGGTLELATAGGSDIEADVRAAGDYGLLIDLLLGPDTAAGVMYSRQETDLDTDPLAGTGETPLRIEYLHMEGLYSFRRGPTRPYVIASVGLTRLEAEGFNPDTRLSWSLGGGVRLFPTGHLGFRLEGRYYGSLLDQKEKEICTDDDEICVDYRDNLILSQVDFRLGLILAF